MPDENRAPSEGGTVQKPRWPEGFWEEFERMPFPADFDLGEDLPDQGDRAMGWYDKPMDDG
jgi:hypothetical protein